MNNLRGLVNRANFALGNRPRLPYYNKRTIEKFIPHNYKAVFIISCDLELAWGHRFSRQIDCDLSAALRIASVERRNTSVILGLADKFGIPITWATVGHLLLESCSKTAGLAHYSMPRPGYFRNKYWRFQGADWFSNDPCCRWQDAPLWYAPDLIKDILSSRVRHEIACHSFSHIDSSRANCPGGLLEKELEKCKEAASSFNVALETFIFPGNLAGNLNVLKKQGFASYRVDNDTLGLPKKDRYGLWQFPSAEQICLSGRGLGADYLIYRYKEIIKRAVKNKRLCHFWFHPSCEPGFLKDTLGMVFEFAGSLRDELYITTIKDYAALLKNGKTL